MTNSTSSTVGNTVKNTSKKVAKGLVLKKLNLATIKIQLIIGGILLVLLLMTILIAGLVSIIGGGAEDDSPLGLGVGQAQVSAEVLQYRDAIFAELSNHGLSEYTELLLALMMQESGGKGNDPMQASESYCGSIGCITDPQLSIEKGVLHFKNVLEKANKDVKLTLQSYNFGGGFIDYVLERGGKYTKELAISFSQMMYQKLSHTGIYKCHRPEAIQHGACYGDIGYVDAVLKYLPSSMEGSGVIGDINSPLKRSLQKNSDFGMRFHPVYKEWRLHSGIDLQCTFTDSIHAVKDGVVTHAGVMGTYGNIINIQHDSFVTGYAHLSSVNVSVGQTVSAGEFIGYCGNTGVGTGAHLHFEIKSENWKGHINPASYLGL